MLSWDQVQRLDSILGESVPIHGRGNFPTLSVQPRQIVQVSLPLCSPTSDWDLINLNKVSQWSCIGFKLTNLTADLF